MRLPPTENRFNRHARLRSGVGNDGLKNQLEILEKEIARVSIGLASPQSKNTNSNPTNRLRLEGRAL